jgi:hypothetical protein
MFFRWIPKKKKEYKEIAKNIKLIKKKPEGKNYIFNHNTKIFYFKDNPEIVHDLTVDNLKLLKNAIENSKKAKYVNDFEFDLIKLKYKCKFCDKDTSNNKIFR